jgi:hypothetical protein
MPRKRLRTTDAYREAIADAIKGSLVLQVIQYLSSILCVMLPSDVISYRRNHHLFRGDPVLCHYAALSFKYPSHMEELATELRWFNERYPRGRQGASPPVRPPDEAYLSVLFGAARRCRANRIETNAMQNQSTGLPQSFTKSGLWRKLDGDEVDGVAAEVVADGVGFDGFKYLADPTLGSSVSKLKAVRAELASQGKNTNVHEVRTIKDYEHISQPLRESHGAGVPQVASLGYLSTHVIRKQVIGMAAVPSGGVDMLNKKNSQVLSLFPDEKEGLRLFPDGAFCRLLEEEMGLPYFWLSCWICLFSSPGISRSDLEAALEKPLVEHLEYIALYNAETGINPPPKDLVRSRPPGDIAEPKFIVSPPAIGDGAGKDASLLLREFELS